MKENITVNKKNGGMPLSAVIGKNDGAISAAHCEEEIQASPDAVERIAKKWKTG